MSGRAGRAAPAAAVALAVALVLGAPLAAGAARAQDGLIHPGSKKKAPPPAAPTATHAVDFPSLEAFRRSRHWKGPRERLARAGLTQDGLAALDQELSVVYMNRELTARSGSAAAGGARPAGQPIGGEASEGRRLWMWQVPMVLDEMKPLWDTLEWDAPQFQRAVVAAGFFVRDDGPRRLTFVEGKHAENQAQLEQLVAWFRVEAGRPESFALMLISEEDGPWPLEEGKAASKDVETAAIDFEGGRRLVLRHDAKGKGPWMLQLVEGKKPLWTRTFPRLAADAALSFAGAPQSLGERGWVLGLDSGKALTLHLDSQGQPLFYFLAW